MFLLTNILTYKKSQADQQLRELGIEINEEPEKEFLPAQIDIADIKYPIMQYMNDNDGTEFPVTVLVFYDGASIVVDTPFEDICHLRDEYKKEHDKIMNNLMNKGE